MDRRSGVDRRSGIDRRTYSENGFYTPSRKLYDRRTVVRRQRERRSEVSG
ncbi:MAG: hypothetical protein GXP58_07230 [Deltaproteobacteria bacterium]|nr:hypothetical protein [Deltaproteobacteria bacterium]